MTTSYTNQLSDVLDKLDEQTAGQTARKMLDVITAAQEEDFNEDQLYPPETQANRRPGINGYSWYERGFGTRTTGGGAYDTSEQFGQMWKARVINNFKQVLENLTSYGGYLMGDAQVAWAKARGWKNANKVIKNNSDKYLRKAARVLARVNRE